MIFSFDYINSRLDEFYNSSYSSDAEEESENFRVKSEIGELILHFFKLGDAESTQAALSLLIENTGCAEDVAVFKSVIQMLKSEGLFKDKIVEEMLITSPLGRWL
ncbi:hypothetical protein V8J88_10935 [Massilia sp. W12]|uniref:hypothetical protein n=1 Tax=Massilia sp. W12 TaxID=3126507 RepID=UPI0030D10957